MFKCKFLAAATVMLGLCVSAMAENTSDDGLDYKPAPYMFVGLQGGAQTTFSKNYNNLNLITPTASVSFGAFFTPVVGARLHVNGLWNKGGYDENGLDFKYDYKYITTNLDLMINLVNLFAKRDYSKWNVYLITGFGLNTAWDNGDAYAFKQVLPLAYNNTRFSHNIRIGSMLDYNIAKHWSVNLEVSANSLSDRYNSKLSNHDDWQLTAQLGVAYKFGYKKKPVVKEPEPVPVVEEVWETRVDTTWYDETIYEEVKRDRDIKEQIFFAIREDGVDVTQKQITEVAEFLKGVENGEITITSYADKGTGNPKINMGYSKKRAESTKKALIAAGVSEKMIKSVEWKGDTVQPFPENDKNRVSIITGHGVYTAKDPKTVKKFRTKDVRYRVK
jgi:outer membrane protein OmpA-like peptidoglycan-associated protein